MSSNGNRVILNLTFKLIFHLINLCFNGLIIRSIHLKLIGVSNIRLELFYRTILFFSRESLRHTIPKLNSLYSIHHYINLIWAIISIGLISILFIVFIEINNHENFFPFYNLTFFMYAFAALIELLSEPFYLLAIVAKNDYINIYIQFIASIIAFGIQTILLIKNGESSFIYYGFGYIIYSTITTLSYYIYFLIHRKDERRRLFLISSLYDLIIHPTSPYVDHKLVSKTLKYLKEGISILILTEGERYLMTIFYLISYEEQAIFHIIYLLGYAFPRIFFSTLEQIIFNYFQQTFSIIKQDDQQSPPTPTEERTIKLNGLTLYNNLIRLVIIVSLLLITFVIPYSPFLLSILIGSKFLKPSYIFHIRLYCIYILLSGINGINESFSQSLMSIKALNNHRNFLLLNSFIYLIQCYLLIKLFGINGIIIAHCFNLLLRIIKSSYFINQYFNQVSWSKSYLFSSYYIILLLISICLCYLIEELIKNIFGFVLFGIGLFLIIICLTWIEEKELIHYIYCVFKLNNQKK